MTAAPLGTSWPRVGIGNATAAFVAAGAIAVLFGDLTVTAAHPWAEMSRLLRGLLTPDFAAVGLVALVNTLAFAVLGVGLGCTCGFALALVFARWRAVRLLAAFLRSVHELFWALLLMQVLGLGPLTGVLAIALPYTGTFAKVFAEMIEEGDPSAARVLPLGASTLSAFAFARLPDLAGPISSYVLYRLECGLRSTLVLGFIGLPTIGFELDGYFKQGAFAQAAALLACFYALVATRRLWARPVTLPFLILGSLLALPSGLATPHLWNNLVRFAVHAVPAPLRLGSTLDPATWAAMGRWTLALVRDQVLPGLANTLILSQIALVAMAFVSLALFPLICRRFTGPVGRALGRGLLVIARSTPDYLVAYVLLQTLGPSMLPAVVALTLHNGAVVGYLMGRQADALDYRLDAPRGLDLYAYEIVPRLYGQFAAYCLYRWEIILRESAIFGILGVTTLGFYVDAAISELRLDVAVALILVTAAVSMGVDGLSRMLRRAMRIETLPVRSSAFETASRAVLLETA